MSEFLHGVKVIEVNEGISTIRTSSSSVIGIVGTAPEADAEEFPLNTPVLIAGSYTKAAKLGTTGTLPDALAGILAQTGAYVVVVRVEEATKAGEAIEGETLEEGTEPPAPVVDEEGTQLNIIGEAKKDGTYSGVYAFLSAKSILGVTPRILLVPGYSTKEVVNELVSIAERLRAIIVADCPNTDDTGLIEYIKDCTNQRIYAIYPSVINTKNKVTNASPYVAGVIARTDNEVGFWCSPSNKVINGITGLSKPVDFTLGDTASRANYLNSNGIATIVNENGYRLWGNRSTATEGSYQFLCVRRTADIICDSILRAHLWAVDRNIVKNYLVDVTENVNAFLASLKSQGAILDGKCYANKELNTASNIADGKVYFDFDFVPAYPAEQVTFRAYLNSNDIESILLKNLA